MIKIEHNVETNEVVKIELSPEEIAEREKEHQIAQKKLAEANAIINEIFNAKVAAYVKLGLTEEEAKLLLS